MELSSLTRNAAKVKTTLKELPDGSIITTKGCTIYAPTRYRDKGMTKVSSQIYILGIYMITHDKAYAVSSVMCKLRIEPSFVNEVMIDGVEHLAFEFNAGDVVFATNEVEVDDKLPYYVYNEIISSGNVPVFFNYLDTINLFKRIKKHNGLQFTPTIIHMLFSFVGRNKDNPYQFFRQVAKNDTDFSKLIYIPLTSNTHGANNTSAKLSGAYFKDNLTSALVTHVEEEENIEHILRM